uniref:Uncharacterized protein n=1 Tax=uncultured prokaryote TaxID=198431 RepID=A0A0H5Q1E2_9ZZZZ|nr:hypothetical protein [uncultured prokaryote]
MHDGELVVEGLGRKFSLRVGFRLSLVGKMVDDEPLLALDEGKIALICGGGRTSEFVTLQSRESDDVSLGNEEKPAADTGLYGFALAPGH